MNSFGRRVRSGCQTRPRRPATRVVYPDTGAPSSLPTACANRVGLLMTVPDTPSTLSVPLFDPEADEEGPDCEHRDEHAEDDARSDQIGASESVHE